MLCVNTILSTVRSINAMAQQLIYASTLCPVRRRSLRLSKARLSESTQELIEPSITELLKRAGADVASLGQSDRVDHRCSPTGNGHAQEPWPVATALKVSGAQRLPLPAKSPQGRLTR